MVSYLSEVQGYEKRTCPLLVNRRQSLQPVERTASRDVNVTSTPRLCHQLVTSLSTKRNILQLHAVTVFHGTDTDTDFLADLRARILARKSACRGPFSLPRAGHARRSSPTCPRTFVRHARFSSRGCPLGMRACTRVRVLYMINYRVHVYKITRQAHP